MPRVSVGVRVASMNEEEIAGGGGCFQYDRARVIPIFPSDVEKPSESPARRYDFGTSVANG
jgi:hypothetical protein